MGSPCHGYAGLSRQQSAADIIAASDQRLNSSPQRAMNQASGQSGFSPARGHADDTQKVNAATSVRNNDRAAGVLTTSLDLRSYYEREGSPNKYRNLGRKIGASDLDSEEQEVENEALENGTSVTPTVDAMIDSHIALEKSRLQLSPGLNGQNANELGSPTRNQIHMFQPSAGIKVDSCDGLHFNASLSRPTLAPNGFRFTSPSVKCSLQPEYSAMEQLPPDFHSTESKFLGAASMFKLQPPQKARTLSPQLERGVHQARTQAKNEPPFPEHPPRKAADIVSVTSVTSSTASMPAAGAVRHSKSSSKRRIEAPPERFNTYFVSPQGTPNSWKVASCYAIDYNPSSTPLKKQGLPSVIRHTTDPSAGAHDGSVNSWDHIGQHVPQRTQRNGVQPNSIAHKRR